MQLGVELEVVPPPAIPRAFTLVPAPAIVPSPDVPTAVLVAPATLPTVEQSAPPAGPQVVVPVAGAPGAPGIPGPPGESADDIPDMTIYFENGLI